MTWGKLGVLGLGALLLVCTLLAIWGISDAEASVLRMVYGMSGDLGRLANVLTQLGSAWMLLVIVAVLLVTQRNPRIALLVLRNGVLALVLTEILKRLVGRPRPFEVLGDVVAREGIVARGMGFPSGHTAIATAVALTLWPFLPKRWRLVVPCWIGVVAWSRLYLGVHAPLDVVGGFALGALVVLVPGYLSQSRKKRSARSKT